MPYKWFITRPHALEQFKVRANYSSHIPASQLEGDLRKALDEAAARKNGGFLAGLKKERILKLLIEGRPNVYAVIRPAREENYDAAVVTVLTHDMYQSWSKDGKLGSFDDLPEEQKALLPVIKKTAFLKWHHDDKDHFHEFPRDEIAVQIEKLLAEGIPLNNIRMLEELPVRVKVVIDK